MAKGQQRKPQEKKKPKADAGKPKAMSAYKAAQLQQGAPTMGSTSKKS